MVRTPNYTEHLLEIMNKLKYFYFITGASGVGKTTLIKGLEEKYKDKKNWIFFHFDSVGVPSVEEMEKQFGSREEWQRTTIHKWVEKILKEHTNKESVFLEGQVNIDFIREALEKYSLKNFKIILLDCGEQEIAFRLERKRGQSELVNQDMKNWAIFLRKQAQELKITILDTTKLSQEEIMQKFENLVGI